MYADKLPVAQILVTSGADVNAKTEDDKTVLMIAVENSNPDIVKFLLDEADVNAKTKDRKIEMVAIKATVGRQTAVLGTQEKEVFLEDKTALILAVEHGNEEMVRVILDKKPEIDFKNRYGGTALIKAIQRNHECIIKLLLDVGAAVN